MASSRAHIGRLHGAFAALAAVWLLLQSLVGAGQAGAVAAPLSPSGWALSLGADQLCDVRSGDRAPAKHNHSHADCILCRVCSRDAPPVALLAEPVLDFAPLRVAALFFSFQTRRPPPPIGRRSLFSSRAPPSIG